MLNNFNIFPIINGTIKIVMMNFLPLKAPRLTIPKLSILISKILKCKRRTNPKNIDVAYMDENINPNTDEIIINDISGIANI